MPFHPLHINPLPQLVGLKSQVTERPDEPSQFDLQVELGIFQDEVTVDRATIAVSLKQAILSLDIDGLEIIEKSKYGVDHAPSKLTVKMTSESTLQTTVENVKAREAIVAGEMSAITQSAKISASGSAKQTDTSVASLKENRETQSDYYPVKAIGNDAWRITDAAGANLDRTFLNFDVLCGVRMKSARPNQIATTLSLHASARNMNVEIIKDGRPLFNRVGANKEKVIGILVAKGLHEASSQVDYNGVVTFSVSKTEYEG
ncbi:hypothetical protein ASF70_13015 [Rhizobium sp. Leaf321]|uniref:hypothetical protein n=1 Tax=Rhizobium sp. Leaf321 TaxID=1736335 RepID=UPI00071399E1|nr:hypothetical protein [Rhizobium sp. Leaf321]KQQ72445.1 hypothetical protein ASF70_13015 [Rhizobium sp. Leaf321]